jgi:predicted phage-related endonuclease
MIRFPDCEMHRVEQRTPEWFELRRGCLTASEFGPWLLKSDKTSAKARESAICRILAGIAECWEPKVFETDAMRRGTEMEPEAIAAFEKWSGKKVEDVGFCRSIHGMFGCSPDGLIVGESCGIEGKVPIPASHIAYRRAGVIPEQYIYQVHGSMAVTGAKAWYFQSWNPGLASLRILVERDDFTYQLKAALVEFSAQVEEAYEEEGRAWADEYGEVKP